MGNMLTATRLKDAIKESGMTLKAVAEKSDMTRATLYNKLNGKSSFRDSEITNLTRTLNLKKSQRDFIFFNEG